MFALTVNLYLGFWASCPIINKMQKIPKMCLPSYKQILDSSELTYMYGAG